MFERFKALIDERLLEAYEESVRHFGTRDLVMFLFVLDGELIAVPRSIVHAAPPPGLDAKTIAKFTKPASEVLGSLGGQSVNFWLVVAYDDENDMECGAVSAQQLGQGGQA